YTCARSAASLLCLSFSHELGIDAATPPTTQRTKGLRGRRPTRELHARRTGALRRPGCREPSGERVGVRTRHQIFQPRTAAIDHYRCWSGVPSGSATRLTCPFRKLYPDVITDYRWTPRP